MIGVIGGRGPLATADFLGKVIEEAQVTDGAGAVCGALCVGYAGPSVWRRCWFAGIVFERRLFVVVRSRTGCKVPFGGRSDPVARVDSGARE